MNIAICDDEKFYRKIIVDYLQDYINKYSDIKYKEFCCGEDLVEAYNNGITFDIIFLDIEMEDLNGIEAGHKIRELDTNVIISFLTTYKQYVFDSFKICTFDYLIKPIIKDEFNNLMDRILLKYKKDHYLLTVKYQNQITKIEIKEIIYIEGYHRHIFYYTLNKEYESLGKIGDLEKELINYGFMRCHQGFLVNMKYIKSIEDKYILTTNNQKVEMSARKRQECIKIFNKFISRYSL